MPDQVFVHVGLPKTGTTYLQDLMYANREAFARQGVTVVGTHALHYQAASELAGARPARAEEVPRGFVDRVVDEVAAAPTPRVVLSNERYSLLRPRGIDRLVSAFPDVELHVVVTVRDLVAAEPSAWQEYVKNGGTLSWPDFCAEHVSRPQRLQSRRRVRRVLTHWPAAVPPGRVHVITVPPPDRPRELILHRFCGVLGVDPEALDTTEPRRRNTSLDFVATEMLRRLNAQRPGLSVAAQRGEVKQWLANGVLSKRPATSRPALTGDALALAQAENDWLVQRLGRGDLDVTGSLEELQEDATDGTAATDRAAYDVPPEALLEVALEALVLVTERAHRRGRRLRRLRARERTGAGRALGARLRARARRALRRSRG